jgi:tripartite-type tricarboxylate transporter receptor subunit TctC
MLAERLAERWGQPVVVENRQGADGIPAVTTFLAARDTHMLLLSFAGIITVNPLLHERLPTTRSRISCRSCRWPTIFSAFPQVPR